MGDTSNYYDFILDRFLTKEENSKRLKALEARKVEKRKMKQKALSRQIDWVAELEQKNKKAR